jgi:TonB family protein
MKIILGIGLVAAAITSVTAWAQESTNSTTPRLPASHGVGQYGHGSGVVQMDVDYDSGKVIAARMLYSTGNAQFDAMALKEFRTWRFKPKTVRRVKTPISFTKAGARF